MQNVANYKIAEFRGSFRILDAKTNKPAVNARGWPLDQGGFSDAYDAKRKLTGILKFRDKMADMQRSLQRAAKQLDAPAAKAESVEP